MNQHLVVTQVIDLATPLAQELNLELVDIVFQTNQKPPVLRVDIRNPTADTSLDDCEKMSRALEAQLDLAEIVPSSYVLEISSPGISRTLNTDREFISFKGFSVMVRTFAPYKERKEWQGKLQGRDEQAVYINRKGKAIAIPRNLIAKVQLNDCS